MDMVLQTPVLPKTLYGFIFYLVKRYIIFFSASLFFILIFSLNKTVLPIYFGKMIDILSQSSSNEISWQILKVPVIKMAALIIIIMLSFNIYGFLMAIYYPKLLTEIRTIALKYAQNYTHHYFIAHLPGNISQQILNLGENIQAALTLVISELLPFLLAVSIVLSVFYKINIGLLIIAVVWLIFHFSICFYFAKYATIYSREHSIAKNKLMGIIVDSLSNYLSVKLFARAKDELTYINQYQETEQKKAREKLLYGEWFELLLGFCTLLGSGLGLNMFAFYCWFHHVITIGELVIVFTVSWNLTFMVWTSTLYLPEFFSYIGIAKQSFSILTYTPEIADLPEAKKIIVSSAEIEFKNITFSYDPSHFIYQDFNLKIPKKQKIGIVGSSGSGKSTFIQLLLRLVSPQHGIIDIDGQNIAEVTQESLRENISIIPQEAILFHRTIMENVRYAKPDASDAEVIAATRIAQAHEFIIKMPEGYDSLVGERGMKLSGGQRQRIAISRAILKNAPIVIFDEGTSALDAITESYIQDTIRILMKGQTVIVISHRLAMLMEMDRIIVLDQGQIIQDGSPAKLLNMPGMFKTIWESQNENES